MKRVLDSGFVVYALIVLVSAPPQLRGGEDDHGTVPSHVGAGCGPTGLM